MIRKKLLALPLITLIVFSLLSTLNVNMTRVSAVDSPYVKVAPESIVEPTLTPSKNFTISIITDYNGSDITSWQFTLSYNPDVLQGVNVTNGNLTVGGSAAFKAGNFNNETGKLSLTVGFFFDEGEVTSGPGILANVTFTVVDIGPSEIDIGPETKLIGWDDWDLKEYDIIDAATMPTRIQHGFFSNVALTVRPDAPGTFDKWTAYPAGMANWECVDEEIRNDTDYVYVVGPRKEDSYNLQNTSQTGNIFYVRVNIYAKQTTGDEKVKMMLVINETKYYGSEYTPTTEYVLYRTDWTSNPATNSSWTWSDVDSLEAGFESVKVGGWSGELRVSQLYVEVAYVVIHDVAVLNVTSYPTSVNPGQIVNITVTTENQGAETETFNVTTYYDNDPISTKTFENLTSSENTTLTFSWNTTGVSDGNYTIKAVADRVPGETDMADNTFIDDTVTIESSKGASGSEPQEPKSQTISGRSSRGGPGPGAYLHKMRSFLGGTLHEAGSIVYIWPYYFAGATIKQSIDGIEATISVTNPTVRHDGTDASWFCAWIMTKEIGTVYFIQVGWTEDSRKPDEQYVFVANWTADGYDEKLYPEYPISDGDTIKVKLTHSGYTWTAWLLWNENWIALHSEDMPFSTATGAEQSGEVLVKQDSFSSTNYLWGPLIHVPDTAFRDTRVRVNGVWKYWTTAFPPSKIYDDENPYHPKWVVRYYDWTIYDRYDRFKP